MTAFAGQYLRKGLERPCMVFLAKLFLRENSSMSWICRDGRGSIFCLFCCLSAVLSCIRMQKIVFLHLTLVSHLLYLSSRSVCLIKYNHGYSTYSSLFFCFPHEIWLSLLPGKPFGICWETCGSHITTSANGYLRDVPGDQYFISQSCRFGHREPQLAV